MEELGGLDPYSREYHLTLLGLWNSCPPRAVPELKFPPDRETPRNVWGPRRWSWLHREAISYPDEPTPAQAALARRRLQVFLASLPCPECKQHAVEYVRAEPPDFRNSAAYQLWAWRFHNVANAHAKKLPMPIEDYLLVYADERARAPLVRGRYPTAVPA